MMYPPPRRLDARSTSTMSHALRRRRSAVASPAIPAPTISTLRGAPLPVVDIVNPFAFEVCPDIADQASRHAIEAQTSSPIRQHYWKFRNI